MAGPATSAGLATADRLICSVATPSKFPGPSANQHMRNRLRKFPMSAKRIPQMPIAIAGEQCAVAGLDIAGSQKAARPELLPQYEGLSALHRYLNRRGLAGRQSGQADKRRVDGGAFFEKDPSTAAPLPRDP